MPAHMSTHMFTHMSTDMPRHVVVLNEGMRYKSDLRLALAVALAVCRPFIGHALTMQYVHAYRHVYRHVHSHVYRPVVGMRYISLESSRQGGHFEYRHICTVSNKHAIGDADIELEYRPMHWPFV